MTYAKARSLYEKTRPDGTRPFLSTPTLWQMLETFDFKIDSLFDEIEHLQENLFEESQKVCQGEVE